MIFPFILLLHCVRKVMVLGILDQEYIEQMYVLTTSGFGVLKSKTDKKKKKKNISSGFGRFLLDAQDYRLFTARRHDAFINGLSSCIDSLYARLFWPHTLPIQFKASIIWQNVMAIFSIDLYSFARCSQIQAAGGGGWMWACNRKFTVSYRKRKLSSCLEGQKVLHKWCMNIKQNYILASHASTLADMFVSNLF